MRRRESWPGPADRSLEQVREALILHVCDSNAHAAIIGTVNDAIDAHVADTEAHMGSLLWPVELTGTVNGSNRIFYSPVYAVADPTKTMLILEGTVQSPSEYQVRAGSRRVVLLGDFVPSRVAPYMMFVKDGTQGQRWTPWLAPGRKAPVQSGARRATLPALPWRGILGRVA